MDEDGVWGEIVNSTWMLYTMRSLDERLVEDCCKVFNDWLAEYCRHAPNRLYGTSMIHMADIDWAVRELERTTKMGLLFTLHGKDRVNVPRSTIGVFAEAGPVLANEFIFGGVLDRFPKLKLVCSEYEVSWLPYWLFRTKQIQDDFGPAMNIPEIKKPIEEYMSQIYHGLIDDPYLDKVLDVIDPKTIMWGSDFPHARCTYPNTRDVIKRVFGHLDAELRDDIVYRNCARFYNMELPD